MLSVLLVLLALQGQHREVEEGRTGLGKREAEQADEDREGVQGLPLRQPPPQILLLLPVGAGGQGPLHHHHPSQTI